MDEAKPTPRSILAYIATRRTWLIPLIYYIYSYSGLTLEELREITGLRSKILRRALWWLKKYNIVEVTGEKFILKPEYSKLFTELILDYCITGRKHLFRLGKTLFIVAIRKNRVSVSTVPIDLVNELRNLEENIQGEYKPVDLAHALNIPLNLARRVVQAKKLLDECRKK